MTRDKNWERFWSTGSVFDYLAYRGNTENRDLFNYNSEKIRRQNGSKNIICAKPLSCSTEAKNEADHSGADSKGTNSRRKG